MNTIDEDYITTKTQEYKEYVTREKATLPPHAELIKEKIDDGTVMGFINAELSVTMNLNVMQMTIILDALMKYCDYYKYIIADAAINGFKLEEEYVKALMSDIIVVEHLYGLFLGVIEQAKTEYEKETAEEST